MEPKSSYERRFHRGMFGRSFGFATVWGCDRNAAPRARSLASSPRFVGLYACPPPRATCTVPKGVCYLLTYSLLQT